MENELTNKLILLLIDIVVRTHDYEHMPDLKDRIEDLRLQCE